DYPKVPNEDKVMEALRPRSIPPGDYMIPRTSSHQEMRSPAFLEKRNRGPILIMTVLPNGPVTMSGSLLSWFIYCAFVGLFAGYVASRALPVGAQYLQVF